MKKTLLSLCLLFMLSVTAEAQHRPPRHRHAPRRTIVKPKAPKAPNLYNPVGEIRLNVLADLGYNDFGAIFMHEIPYHFSVGGQIECQVGHFTSFGIGAEYYSSYGENCRLFSNMEDTYIHTVPIYANLKLALPDAPISPFIEGRIGYSLPVNEVTCNDPDGIHHYHSTGLYTGGAVGLKIFRTSLSCGVSVIDVVNSSLGFSGGHQDVITDYYVRLSFTL